MKYSACIEFSGSIGGADDSAGLFLRNTIHTAATMVSPPTKIVAIVAESFIFNMQILTGEFVILSLLLFIATRIKVRVPTTERILRNLCIYLPPREEQIKAYTAGSKEFSLMTARLDDDFSRKSNFFGDIEFLLLISVITAGLCLANSLLSGIELIKIEHNLSFYLCMLVISLCIGGAYSQSVKSGIRNPDNIIGLIISLGLLFFSAVLLISEHQKILDFNFHFSSKLLSLSVTRSLTYFWDVSVEPDYTMFSVLISVVAALSLFPFFKYLFKFVLNICMEDMGKINVEGEPHINLKLQLIYPLVVLTFWVKPMTKNFLVPEHMAESSFEYLRVSLVVIYILLRLSQVRDEVQTLLNQAKYIVYSILAEPTKENIAKSTEQIAAYARYAWPFAHLSLCYTVYLAFLVILLLNKSDLSKSYPKPLSEQLEPEIKPLVYDDDEFTIIQQPAKYGLITPSRKVYYYQEIRDYETSIQAIAANRTEVNTDVEDVIQKIVEINREGVIPDVFYRDLIQYFIFLNLWFNALSYCFGLLYSRRFANKTKTS